MTAKAERSKANGKVTSVSRPDRDPRNFELAAAAAMIADARPALAAFIVAHAKYEEAWAAAWPVIKSARHFRQLDQCEPSQRAVKDNLAMSRQALCETFEELSRLLDDKIGHTIQETWTQNRYQIEATPIAALAARYIEGCAALAWHIAEDEVPPCELREDFIVRASIGLALLGESTGGEYGGPKAAS